MSQSDHRDAAPQAARIVALDTASSPATVALFVGSALLSMHSGGAGNAQGESLLTLLDAALSEASWKRESVRTWVAGRGPGSFTGIRIALATVQGIVLGSAGAAEGAPDAWGITSFEALRAAFQQETHEGPLAKAACVLAALPGEVYLSMPEETPVWCTLEACERTLAACPDVVVLGAGAALLDGIPNLRKSSGLFAGPNAASIGAAFVQGVRGPCSPLYVAEPKISMPRARNQQ
jgi:tRNA threonylcarbamoyl adenosine modification protein YeaZ